MVFWQLTVDAKDPALLAHFWAQALDYRSTPPAEPQTTWNAHYRMRLHGEATFEDRIFDPAGLRPPIWFQHSRAPHPVRRPGRPRVLRRHA